MIVLRNSESVAPKDTESITTRACLDDIVLAGNIFRSLSSWLEASNLIHLIHDEAPTSY